MTIAAMQMYIYFLVKNLVYFFLAASDSYQTEKRISWWYR